MRQLNLTHRIAIGTWAIVALTITTAFTADAAPLKTTTGVGLADWSNAGFWTPAGAPVAGQSVQINHSVTVSSPAAFGDSTENSIWGPGWFTINAGSSLTNTAGTFVIPTTSPDVRVFGGGTFVNAGTIDHNSGGRWYLLGGPSKISNSGDFVFSRNDSHIDLREDGTRFTNLAGGDVIVSMPNATDVGRFMADLTNVDGKFSQQGNPITFNQGVLVMAAPGGFGQTINDAFFTSLVGAGANPINGNSELRFAGGLDDIILTGGSKLDRVRFGSGTDAVVVRSGGMILNVSGDGIRTASSGLVTIDTGAGRTLTNQGKLVLDNSSGDVRIGGGGSVDNTGTIQHRNVQLYVLPSTTAALNNSGLYEFTDNGALFNLHAPGGSLNNLVGGTIRTNLASSGSTATVYTGGGSVVTFSNLGTVESIGGTFSVASNILMPQISSTALLGGTWRVLANTFDAALNLQASSTSVGTAANYDGSIVTVGAGAGLVLSQQGAGSALFPQLGVISSVAGSLDVHGSVILPVSAALNVSGALGGNGTINSPGTITFSGGELDPSSLTGGAGTLTINGNLVLSDTTDLAFALGTPNVVGGVNDLVVVNGNLTLDGALDLTELAGFGSGNYRLFNYTGSLTNGGVQLGGAGQYYLDLSVANQVSLVVLPVPEPTTGLLLLGGLCLFARRK